VFLRWFRWAPPSPGAKPNHRLRLLAGFHVVPSVAGLTGVCIGLVVFFGGWVGRISILRTMLPDAQYMKANTALGIAFLGAALWLDGRSSSGRKARWLALTLAAMTTLIGTLTFLEHAIHRSFHIDELLIRDYVWTVSTNAPGRMAVATAINFMMLGCSLLFAKRRRGVVPSQALAMAVGCLCLVNVIGYVYGIRNYLDIAFYSTVALHTSFALLILSLGVLCLTPNAGLMATVTSEQLGGVLARRLLPAAVLVPVGLGWLRWQGQLRGYYDTAFGLAIFTSAIVVVFLILIGLHSGLLNGLDRERLASLEESQQRLEARVQERTLELEKSNNLLNAILDSMGDGVICANEKYEHILFNHAARKLLGAGPGQPPPERRSEVFGLYRSDRKTLYKSEDLPLGRALRGETCDNVELFAHHPDAQQGRWLSASARPLMDHSGKLHGGVVVLHDITERKRSEEAQARLLSLLEETSDFVGMARPDGTVLYANRALRKLRGLTEGESIEDLRVEGAYPPNVAEQILLDATQAAIQFGAWRGETTFKYHSGEEIAVSQLIMSHRNGHGELEFLSTIARDISEIKDKEGQLEVVQQQLEESLTKERELARQDPLTGLANRRAFLETSEAEKERSRRYHHCFNIAYIDLDGFKKVNDTLGHAVGDQVLRQVGKTLRSNLRSTDAVARLGGDEFAILLVETDSASAEQVLRKLHELLRAAMKQNSWNVDFSIGLASYLSPPESIDNIIRTADGLMYSVKARGKGNLAVAFFA
jgi:diguanylate cyclase (GGDEF)-like protein/PAS domain S-box-containing protein